MSIVNADPITARLRQETRLIVAALAGVLVTAALGAGIASAGGPAIEYVTGFDSFKVSVSTKNGVKASGKVDSTESECVGGRKVKLIRKRNGKKKTLGSDKTNDKGKFKIHSSSAKNGKYWGVITKKSLSPADTGQDRVCIKETSGSVKVS